MKSIDWNEISELGLLERINREIMHPLGLAVYRNPDEGTSGGAIVSEDGKFEFGNIESKIISNSDIINRVHNV